MEWLAYLGKGCGLPRVVSECLAVPTASKENKALVAARVMEARMQEKPELKAGASREARGWISGATGAGPLETSPASFHHPTLLTVA